ncbi:MAG: glycosyltransferase, partial [Chloroflexota bacterium]
GSAAAPLVAPPASMAIAAVGFPTEAASRPAISAAVLTLNEARHIVPCLRMLHWAGEVLVVDCGSADGTPELARSMGARVLHHDWNGWAAQRNFAIAQASLPWIFFVDADERVPLKLAEEIRARVAGADRAGGPAGFWVPRQNLILGRWVRHAGWWPDYQLRLFRRDRGHYDPGRPVHELVLLDGDAEHLRHHLVHHNYATWRQFWAKQRRYAREEAQALHAQGVRVKPQNFVLQPLREFRRRYWTLRGYRAGRLGFSLSALLAVANFLMYVDLWRLTRQRNRDTKTNRQCGQMYTDDATVGATVTLSAAKSPSNSPPARLPLASRGQVPAAGSLRSAQGQAGPAIHAAPDDARRRTGAAAVSSAVTVVVVSYNVAPLLERCLASVRRASEVLSEPLDVVVVDNASRDGSADLVRERFPEVGLVVNHQNRGFGAACNQGAAGAGAFTLFLNPDAELTTGALPALLGRIRATPHTALVGPRVEYPDGRPQPTRRRFPTAVTLLIESTPVQWRLPRGWVLDDYYCADLPEDVAEPVDWLSGACLLVRTRAFRQVGGFDPAFFMYFEEVDLCRRLAAFGWQTWYEPSATVVHHHSRSADQDVRARDRTYFRSKYCYAARYWGGMVARGLRCAASASFAAELAIQTVRRDRAETKRYASLVRWHFSGEA